MQQINLQATNATSLSTGRYTYSAQVVDIGSSNVTTNLQRGNRTCSTTQATPSAPAGRSKGLEHIYSESGGVILDLGDDGRTFWFASSGGGSGGSYTDPPANSRRSCKLRRRLDRYADRRHSNHVQFGRLRDCHHRSQQQPHHVCIRWRQHSPRSVITWVTITSFPTAVVGISRASQTRPARHHDYHEFRRQPDPGRIAGRVHLELRVRLGWPVDQDH